MIFFDLVRDYEEFIYDPFIEHGNCTMITFQDNESVILLSSFNEFKRRHDDYMKHVEDEQNKIIIKGNN